MNVDTPSVDWFALSPVLSLLAASGIALLGAVIFRRRSKGFAWFWTLMGFAVALVFAAVAFVDSERAEAVIGEGMIRDRWAFLAQMIICGSGLVTVLLSWNEPARRDVASVQTRVQSRLGAADHTGEYYALLAAAAAGMCFFVQANNLMTLFLGLEWFSIALYILCAVHAERTESLEAGLKYLIVGSFGSSVLLFGSALVYGATGELAWDRIAAAGDSGDPLFLAGLAMVIGGLGFKASAAPFHMWTPDVYQGAPTPVTAFMSVGTKVTTFGALVRMIFSGMPALGNEWANTLFALAIVTMIVGNLAAITQRNIKRMLAYSSIGQAGYVLIGVVAAGSQVAQVRQDALGAILFYLLAYTFMNLGAFAVVVALARPGYERLDLEQDFAGLAQRRPWLAAAMTLFMLSLGGVPPTAGFMGKLMLFRAAVEAGHWPLALVGVLTSVVALAFYLRVVIQMYARDSAVRVDEHLRVPAPLAVVLAVCVLLTLQFGILPALPLDLAQQALVGALP